MSADPAALYHPRRPTSSPLYRLVESCYDEVKGQWEERFERRYGFWRGAVEDTVFAFLDCGIFEHGFARVRCTECAVEEVPKRCRRGAKDISRAESRSHA